MTGYDKSPDYGGPPWKWWDWIIWPALVAVIAVGLFFWSQQSQG